MHRAVISSTSLMGENMTDVSFLACRRRCRDMRAQALAISVCDVIIWRYVMQGAGRTPLAGDCRMLAHI